MTSEYWLKMPKKWVTDSPSNSEPMYSYVPMSTCRYFTLELEVIPNRNADSPCDFKHRTRLSIYTAAGAIKVAIDKLDDLEKHERFRDQFERSLFQKYGIISLEGLVEETLHLLAQEE